MRRAPFYIEVCCLVAFVIAASALLLPVYAYSLKMSDEASGITNAVMVAADAAAICESAESIDRIISLLHAEEIGSSVGATGMDGFDSAHDADDSGAGIRSSLSYHIGQGGREYACILEIREVGEQDGTGGLAREVWIGVYRVEALTVMEIYPVYVILDGPALYETSIFVYSTSARGE